MSPFEIRPGIRRLFRLAVRRPDGVRSDVDEEIRLHLKLRTDQLVAEGLSPEAARAEAERRFGPLDEARSRLHTSASRREGQMRVREQVEAVARGLRVSVRGLRRSPGFVVTVVTCIALGVGANAAAYSLFDEMVLRPLPVREPQRLVNLAPTGPIVGNDNCNQAGGCDEVFSLPMFRDLAQARRDVAGLAGHRPFTASISDGAGRGQPTSADGIFVTGSYFPTLGLTPALGRLLGPADDQAVGADEVVVLGHAFWESHFGADPGVVGRQIVVNDRALTVVGVAPRGFEGTTLGLRAAVYIPMTMAGDLDFNGRAYLADRRSYWVYLFARLAPGVTREGAQAALTATYRGILADVEAPLHPGLSARTMARFKAKAIQLADGRHGQSSLRGQARTPLVLLFAITGLVLLIACANIANLLLVRGAGRATEIAVRMSLGAGRRRLVWQLLAESVLLALLGGVASLVVAHGTLALIGSFLPPAELGMGPAVALAVSPSVLAFAGAVSLATGLLFGLFPALHATRADLITSVRAGAGQILGGHRSAARFRTTLVTAQIALSMALLASAGLFIRSLRNVARVDLGLDVEQVVTFAILPQLSGYSGTRSHELFRRVEEEVGALPGVTAVAGSTTPILTGSSSGGDVRVEGFARGPDTDANARFIEVGPAYFRALGVSLLAGREFTEADRLGTSRVAVVSETFARKFGLGRNPVGKRMAFDDKSPKGPLDVEIVGLVRDARFKGIKEEMMPVAYRPARQDTTIGAMAFYARTTRPPAEVLRRIPATIARLDRGLPVSMLKPMAQQARENVYLDRMVGALSAGFAALATLLAAVGLYGVLAYTVAQRTREIGVRMALGADGRRVRGMVLRQVGRMALVGGAVGVVAALALGRAVASLLFGVAGHDPVVLVAAAAVLAAAALVAGWIPAWRASRLSPVEALRGD